MTHRPERHFLRTTILAALALGLLVVCSSSFAKKDNDLRKHYGLIFGTAYGPDDRPLYGVRIQIHPVDKKHPSWELVSDHRGEFAQRVPPGPGDYMVSGEGELLLTENGKPHKKKFKAETKVHITAEERQDVSLHFRE